MPAALTVDAKYTAPPGWPGFLGSWFTTVEFTISAASTGDGTENPVTWNNTGGTTDDEMCQFEWATKTVRLQISGTATLTFYDFSGTIPPAAPEVRSFPFTFDLFDTPVSGTTWDVVEPSDLVMGGRDFSNADTQIFPVTLPWGTDHATITAGFEAKSLSAINGTTFLEYVKRVIIGVEAVGDTHTAPILNSKVQWNTSTAQLDGAPTATGINATTFHSVAQFHSFDRDGASITL